MATLENLRTPFLALTSQQQYDLVMEIRRLRRTYTPTRSAPKIVKEKVAKARATSNKLQNGFTKAELQKLLTMLQGGKDVKA